jgi:hypothetical protein
VQWALVAPPAPAVKGPALRLAALGPRELFPTPDRVLAPRAMRYTLVAMSTRNIAIAALVIVVVVVIIVFVL